MLQHTAPLAPDALLIDRRFDAPSAVVFRLWTSPDLLAHWWGPRDFAAHSIEMDFRRGGKWRAVIRSARGEDFAMSGVYREIVEGKCIVFTFTAEGGGRETLVTVTFEDVKGTTRLEFRQEPFTQQAEIEAHMESWGECLDRLESYLLRYHWNNR
ncbi:SRPBCC domain-containing protein [Rhizobium sp. ARZ01]|nr:SRPBCC domain-containing protein [Rhizobium sp. ARZ01]